MTKEQFFEEHMEEKFEWVEDNLKEILEEIREYNGMSEDEFYTQILEEGDKWDCGTYTIFNLIVDGIEANVLSNSYIEKFIQLSFIKKAFAMETGKEIEEVYEETSQEEFEDMLWNALGVIQSCDLEIEEDEEDVMDLLVDIIKDFCAHAYYCPACEDGEHKGYHVIVSQEFLAS